MAAADIVKQSERGAVTRRLLTVSNRGPVEFQRDEDGELTGVPGQGGLATALRVAAEIQSTTWLSSPITDVDREIAAGHHAVSTSGGSSRFVVTDQRAYDLFYGSFANEALWFLQHAMPFPDELNPQRLREAWSDGYVVVNQAFADEVVEELAEGGYRAVMFHDYHFYLAPALVKAARPEVYLQHFIHIPWPGPSEWQRLEKPMLEAIVRGLLGNDSLVFQTPDSVRDFLDTVRKVLPDASVDVSSGLVASGGHATRVWANGISVDPGELESAAGTPEFSRHRWLLRSSPGQKTIVRVDRLDPSKNVVRGFEAYRLLLRNHPELREHIYFLALLVPTRSDIPFYRSHQEETHALAAALNSEFGNYHWKPLRLIFEHNRVQALAAMSLYDVLLVNSLADGMNLVAKEGPMLNMHDGVLVLSKRAGAYAELGEAALAIDPEDVEQTAEALYQALRMDPKERRERSSRLRKVIREHDLMAWFAELLDDINVNAPLAESAA
jgi:trehalose 6-phosphate synthase